MLVSSISFAPLFGFLLDFLQEYLALIVPQGRLYWYCGLDSRCLAIVYVGFKDRENRFLIVVALSIFIHRQRG